MRMFKPSQNSNVLTHILVFFATLHLSYTPTNTLIMPLFFLKVFNDFLLHSESCQPFSACCIQPSISMVAPSIFNLSLILFPPTPFSHGDILICPGHPCFCALACIFSSFPNTPLSLTHPSLVLKSLTVPIAFSSCFYFSAPRVSLELEIFIYMFVPFTSLSS